MTLSHAWPLTPPRPPCSAIALPVRPAMRAWLSLVGMPKYQASTAQITIASRAADRATMASWEFVPKSTMLAIVWATVALSELMTKTPRKLKTADIRIAGLASMHLVVTQVAIALGQSVQPLTKMTPRVRPTESIRRGFDMT